MISFFVFFQCNEIKINSKRGITHNLPIKKLHMLHLLRNVTSKKKKLQITVQVKSLRSLLFFFYIFFIRIVFASSMTLTVCCK